jgi:hypothetical protein
MKRATAAAVFALALAAGPARGASQKGTFVVQVEVQDACSVDLTSPGFARTACTQGGAATLGIDGSARVRSLARGGGMVRISRVESAVTVAF